MLQDGGDLMSKATSGVVFSLGCVVAVSLQSVHTDVHAL